jgi:myosin heavy subunit
MDDDIVFVRSIEKPRALDIGDDHPRRRAKHNDGSAQDLSPSPATREQIGGNESQPKASNFNSTVPLPGEQGTFLLATRKALESAVGKEALERSEQLLKEEQDRTEQYIAQLEKAVKDQNGGPVSHDILIQNQIAMLKVKAKGQDEAARTEINILHEHNKKLSQEKTALVRSVNQLKGQHSASKAKVQDDANAESQILHEHNTKLAKEKADLVRSVKLLKDESFTLNAKGPDDKAARTEIRMLHEHTTNLAEEKTALVCNLKLLKEEHGTLRAEISALTQNLCEQKKLCASKKMYGSGRDSKAAAAELRKHKKELRKCKKLNSKMVKENKKLSEKVAELETERLASLSLQKTAKDSAEEASKAHERIEKLQNQIVKLDRGFRQRGEQLIELSRDSVSKDKIKMQKKAAVEAKGLLQTRMSGMFRNYQMLHKKNTALLEKLVSTAEARGFGDADSTYRKELKLLKGQPLEKLCEFKNQV